MLDQCVTWVNGARAKDGEHTGLKPAESCVVGLRSQIWAQPAVP